MCKGKKDWELTNLVMESTSNLIPYSLWVTSAGSQLSCLVIAELSSMYKLLRFPLSPMNSQFLI